MSWMDLNEYVLIEGVARDRLDDFRRASARRGVNMKKAPMSTIERMLYVASVLRALPRAIDRYIDYFGDRVLQQR